MRLSLQGSPAAACKIDERFCKAAANAGMNLHLLCNALQLSFSQGLVLEHKVCKLFFFFFNRQTNKQTKQLLFSVLWENTEKIHLKLTIGKIKNLVWTEIKTVFDTNWEDHLKLN